MGHTGSRQAGWRKVDDDRVDEGAAPFPFHAMLTSLAFACMGRHRPGPTWPRLAKHVEFIGSNLRASRQKVAHDKLIIWSTYNYYGVETKGLLGEEGLSGEIARLIRVQCSRWPAAFQSKETQIGRRCCPQIPVAGRAFLLRVRAVVRTMQWADLYRSRRTRTSHSD